MFWSQQFRKKKPTVKPGFLAPDDGGDMRPATLYIYNNGTMIVNAKFDNYEVTGGTERVYDVKCGRYPRFIVTE